MQNKPIIFYEGSYTEKDLNDFQSSEKIWKIVDIYEKQLGELFEITNPNKKFTSTFTEEQKKYISETIKDNQIIKGNWVYFPWSGNLIHTVTEKDYFILRTNRNKNIINESEQEKLYSSCIGFMGLSIGSHMVTSMAYSGIGRRLKIAEFDKLETSNLNRIRAGIQDIGSDKIDLTLQSIYEINPYAQPITFSTGVKENNLPEFIQNDPKPSIIIEAVDDFVMKIKVRIEARKAGIPVIMLTNLDDNLLVDVERYDLDRNLPLFNGVIGNTPEQILENPITEKDKVKYAMQIVGVEHLSTRILESLFEINKSLVGRPQIYTTVTIAGGFAAYLTKLILLNKTLKSGRTFISFNQLMNIKESDDEQKQTIINKLYEHIK